MGDLEPARKYTQGELSDTIGVSTMPVREALLRLSHEGLVKSSPSRSYEVVRMSRSDVEDVYWLYASLAGELTARACSRASLALLDDLTAINEELLALGRVPSEKFQLANWKFHRALNKAADAPRLVHALSRTVRLIPEHLFIALGPWVEIHRQDHETILEAVRTRDAEAGRLAGADHARRVGQLVLTHFSDAKGTWDPPDGAVVGHPPPISR